MIKKFVVLVWAIVIGFSSMAYAGSIIQGSGPVSQVISTPLTIQNSSTVYDTLAVDSSNNLKLNTVTQAPGAVIAALAGAGAGNVNNGTHSYKFTFVTASGETAAGAVSNTITVVDKTVDGKVTLSNLPKLAPWVTALNVYRTAAGNAATGPWKLVESIAVGVQTPGLTYTDNTADASLGATIPATNTTLDTTWTFTNTGNIYLNYGGQFSGVSTPFLLTTGGQYYAATYSVFLGPNAGSLVATQGGPNALANVGIGSSALSHLTTGDSDTAVGAWSGRETTGGISNTSLGAYSLVLLTTGNENTALGTVALNQLTTGSANTAVGNEAGRILSGDSYNNTFIGHQSGMSATTLTYNNTAVGKNSLRNMTVAYSNTCIGVNCGYSLTTGLENVGVGMSALNTVANNHYNTAVGFQALDQVDASSNIALGWRAGHTLTSGSGNIYIGNTGAATESNTIRIGTSQTSLFIAGVGSGSAGGKKVLCVDTTTGQLWASSTTTDCTN